MKNVSIKKIFLAIITLVIGLGAHMLSSKLLTLAGITFTSQILDQFVNEVIFAAVVVAIIFIIKKQSVFRFDTDGFLKGLKAGIPVIVYSVMLILVSLSKLQGHTLVKGWEIFLFIIFCLLIGVAEEGLFRGAVQELVMDAFAAKTRNQQKVAIIVASVIFGSAHFINLRLGANLGSVILQVISATAAGMLFGAICVRSGRSLWAAVIAHALMDCGAFVNDGMLWGQNVVDAVNGLSAGVLITTAVDIALFFYIMNRIDEDEAEEANTATAEVPTTGAAVIPASARESTTTAKATVTSISSSTKKSHKKGIIIGVAVTSFILVTFLVILPMIMTTF